MALRAIDPASLFTYTQPDPTWHFNANGVLVKETTPDTLVVDHKYDAGSGLWVPRGQPLFPEVEQLCGRSNSLNVIGAGGGTTWVKKGGRIDTPFASTVTGPDGLASMWGLRAPNTGGDRVLQWIQPAPGDGVFTLQGIVAAKPGNAATHMNCFFRGVGGGAGEWSYLNLATGSWTLGAGLVGGAEPLGASGLWFFWVIGDATLSGASWECRIGPAQGETNTASGGDEIAAGWVVIHRHPFPVPYVEANNGTPVVRSWDNCYVDGATARWFHIDRVAIYADMEMRVPTSDRFDLSGNQFIRPAALHHSRSNRFELIETETGSGVSMRAQFSTAAANPEASIDDIGDEVSRVAAGSFSWKEARARVAARGEGAGAEGADLGADLFYPGSPVLRLGNYGGATGTESQWTIAGWMRRARVIPRDLSVAELEALVA